jgi:hypothetical protein
MHEQLMQGGKAIWNDPSSFLTKENMKYGLAAAAPLMNMSQKQSEPEKDSEQYKYTYSPGRVENPEEEYTGPYSGERTWFNPSYTRVMAEGGAVDNEVVEYEYDPLTQTYKKKTTPVAKGAVDPVTSSTARTGGSYRPPKPGEEGYNDWQDKSPLEKAQFFHENPTWAKFHNLALQGLGATTLGMAIKAINPEGYARELAISSPGGVWSKYAVGPMTEGAQGNIYSEGQAGPLSGSAWNVGGGGGNYGGWNGTAADNSNRSDPSAVGSMADTAGDKAGGRIGDKKHHRPPMRQGLGSAVEKGRFLEGPGDGVSDSIPATINGTQPARLADGEFVIPARIVSELGNGSSKAGARKLYAMMDRIQNGRSKTTGKGRVAVDSKADKHLPA